MEPAEDPTVLQSLHYATLCLFSQTVHDRYIFTSCNSSFQAAGLSQGTWVKSPDLTVLT